MWSFRLPETILNAYLVEAGLADIFGKGVMELWQPVFGRLAKGNRKSL